MSPSGTVTALCNTPQTFTITPDTFYIVSDVLFDGVTVGTPDSYTFDGTCTGNTISENTHSLAVTFNLGITPQSYSVETSTNGNGEITPSVYGMPCNTSKTFIITPHEGYYIQDVLFDNVSVGTVSSYIVEGICTGVHTLKAIFVLSEPAKAYLLWTHTVEYRGLRLIATTNDDEFHLAHVLMTKDSKGGILVSGVKNSDGYLTTITDLHWIPDINDHSEGLHIYFDNQQQEVTITNSTGEFMKLEEYNSNAKTFTLTKGQKNSDGSITITEQTENIPDKNNFFEMLAQLFADWEEQLKAKMKALFTLAGNLAPTGIKDIFRSLAGNIEADIDSQDQCIIDMFSIFADVQSAASSWEDCFLNANCNWLNIAIETITAIFNTSVQWTKESSLTFICNGSTEHCGDIPIEESASLEVKWVNPQENGGWLDFPPNGGNFSIGEGATCGTLNLKIKNPGYIYSGIRKCTTPSWGDSNIRGNLYNGDGELIEISNLINFLLVGNGSGSPCYSVVIQ